MRGEKANKMKKFDFNNSNNTVLKEFLEQQGTINVTDQQLATEWNNWCEITYSRIVPKTEQAMGEFAMYLSKQDI